MTGKNLAVLTSLVLISLLLGGGGICYAISGQCSNCHTMHNSQGGASEVEFYAGGSLDTTDNPAQNKLLRATCIACHTGASGSTNSTNVHGAPIVLHISEPGGQGRHNTLAGGDFYWVADGLGDSDAKGHNVAGISSEDDPIGQTPPGWDPTATPGDLIDGTIAGGAGAWASQLTCAGQYGCHGNHIDADPNAAITGAHHGNTGLTATQAELPTTVGDSYRFLGGIKGLENSEWNWDENISTHNEYYGVILNTVYGDKSTISYSCAQCHGDFHENITIGGPFSPWTGHPTDIVLEASSEFDDFGGQPNPDYSLEVPVARGDVPSSSSSSVWIGDASSTGAIVMCLSCHRAHGSPENDLLRWTYDDMVAGAGPNETGCFSCHTSKDD